jgi:hypothetical protein
MTPITVVANVHMRVRRFDCMIVYRRMYAVITIVWTMKSCGHRRDLKGQHGH